MRYVHGYMHELNFWKRATIMVGLGRRSSAAPGGCQTPRCPMYEPVWQAPQSKNGQGKSRRFLLLPPAGLGPRRVGLSAALHLRVVSVARQRKSETLAHLIPSRSSLQVIVKSFRSGTIGGNLNLRWAASSVFRRLFTRASIPLYAHSLLHCFSACFSQVHWITQVHHDFYRRSIPFISCCGAWICCWSRRGSGRRLWGSGREIVRRLEEGGDQGQRECPTISGSWLLKDRRSDILWNLLSIR